MKGLTNASGGIPSGSIGTEQLVNASVSPAKMADGAIPVKKTLTLNDQWTGESSPYTQTVTVTGYTLTANSKVNLQPDATVINQLIEDGTLALYIVNNNGTLTAYAVGEAPSVNLYIQATIEEVR